MAAVAGLALFGAATAHAQALRSSAGVTADGFATESINAAAPRSSLEWDAKRGRWGLKLESEQHVVGDVRWRDLQPGLYYRVTPRLHIGGAVNLAPEQPELGRADVQPPPPRVRLETTLRF